MIYVFLPILIGSVCAVSLHWWQGSNGYFPVFRQVMVEKTSCDYYGYMKTGRPDGKGVLDDPVNRQQLRGVWCDGDLRAGIRRSVEDGVVREYSGPLQDLKEEGFGSAIYADGRRYWGEWHHGQREGSGREVKDTSFVFGRWKDGILASSSDSDAFSSKIYGIDVSHHNNHVDWEKLTLGCDADGVVHQDGIGRYSQPVVFAFVKSTEGATVFDEMFNYNFAEAKRCGIVRGAYHFLTTAAVEGQIENFIRHTHLEKGDLPPVLDIEINPDVMQRDSAKLLNMALSWLNAVEAHYGKRPIIYCSNSYYDRFLRSRLGDYQCWIARYSETKNPDFDHVIWQFSERGQVKAIEKSHTDLNLFRGTYAGLMRLVYGVGAYNMIYNK